MGLDSLGLAEVVAAGTAKKRRTGQGDEEGYKCSLHVILLFRESNSRVAGRIFRGSCDATLHLDVLKPRRFKILTT